MKKEYPTYKLSTPFFKSGLLDSNQRPRAPQTCALPTAPNPDLLHCLVNCTLFFFPLRKETNALYLYNFHSLI